MERLTALEAWDSFYVIVGSSAAALTGLQFVVITIIGEQADRTTPASVGAFGTPTVVHFCAALLVSAILSAPWNALSSAIGAVGFCGVAGVAYTAVVIRRARLQKGYEPVLEDWIFHAVLPMSAYVLLLVSVAVARQAAQSSLFLVAGAALVLLFIGIHNAWDTVTYMAIERRARKQKD